MTPPFPRIGIVTCGPAKLADSDPTAAETDFVPTEPPFTPDDQLLAEELRRRGRHVSAVVWGAETSRLTDQFDRLIVRSPWDYMESDQRREEFLNWLENLATTGLIVENEPQVMLWLMDQRLPASGQIMVHAERGGSLRFAEPPSVLRQSGHQVAHRTGCLCQPRRNLLPTIHDPDGAGFLGTVAAGINNFGVVVGYYDDAAGYEHAFIASPVPEPSSGFLLGTAIAMALASKFDRRDGRLVE